MAIDYSQLTDAELDARIAALESDQNIPETVRNISDAELDARLANLEQQERVEQSKTGSILDPLAQGLTLNFADELAGLVGALPASMQLGVSPLEAYRGIRDTARSREQRYREQNPGKSLVAELAGGLTTGAAGAARLLGAAPTLARSVAVGAGEGGAAGLGAGEGGIGQQLASTTLGAGLGVAGGAIGRGIEEVARRAVPRTTGQNILQESIEATGMTPAALLARQRQMGPQGTLADVGASPRYLAQAAAIESPTSVGYAQRSLEGRIPGQGDMLRDVFEEATGIRPDYEIVAGNIDQIARQRSAQAGPLFRALDQYEIPLTEPLKRVLDTDIGQRAFQRAQRQAAMEGEDLPPLLRLNDAGEWEQTGVMPNMSAWTRIKTQIQDLLDTEDYLNPTTRRPTSLGRSASRMYDDMVDELDTLTQGDYRRALDAWAGPSAVMNALDRGRGFMNSTVSDVRQQAARMSQSEKSAYLSGVVESIQERMARAIEGTASETRFMETKAFKDKLAAILPEGRAGQRALARINRALRNQRTFRQTPADVLRGSQTEIRRRASENLRGQAVQPADYIESALSPVETGTRMIKERINRMTKLPQSDVEELSRLLVTPNGIPAALDYLNRAPIDPNERFKLINAIITGSATAGAGISDPLLFENQ